MLKDAIISNAKKSRKEAIYMSKGVYIHKNSIVKDHLGNEYESFCAMCRAYEKPMSTVQNRLQRNWTLEQALTIDNKSQKAKINHKKIWTDHLGNCYNSLPEMCAAYNINEKIYQSRVRLLKWDLEKTLTTPVIKTPKNAKTVRDHLGNEFSSVSEMCRFHNIKLTRYKERVKVGWDVEKALTTPAKQINDMTAKTCYDHLGNKFKSQNEMCRYYNIKRHTLKSRLELGWTLEQALTGNYVINNITAIDYKNREFPTLKDIANFYALNAYMLQGNKKFKDDNKTELIRLLKNNYKQSNLGEITIVKCISFPYFKTIIKNHEYIMHLEEILDIYHNSNMFQPLPKTKSKPVINIKRRIKFPYYVVNIQDNKNDIVMSYWEIIKLNTESNFGLKKNTAD